MTNFAAYGTAFQTVVDAVTAREALGSFPQFPMVIAVDSDYDTVIAGQATWLTSVEPLTDTLNDAQTALTQARYNLQHDSIHAMIPNEWHGLTAHTSGDFGHFPNNVWVAYAAVSGAGIPATFIVLTYAPANSFPDTTP